MDRLVDVYPYRKGEAQVEFLVLKRSPQVIYGGQWRMIGGKVRKDEKTYVAALRELDEETALQPKLFWTLPSINQFYDPGVDAIRQIPAFAAEVEENASITLNYEHVDYKWIHKEQIASHIQWPEQQRLMCQLHTIVTQNQLLDEWIIES